MIAPLLLFAMLAAPPEMLGPGDYPRTVTHDGLKRLYHLHLPQQYDARTSIPVVLALHGAAMNGRMMIGFCGLNAKADAAGFAVVYPDGTGLQPFLTWNAGALGGRLADRRVDDVAFIAAVLDDVQRIMRVDTARIYACGMSNGGMMCYRLAAELSDRIAAIAPVAGTVALEENRPARAVPVIHFHGTDDRLVPYSQERGRPRPFVRLRDVDESIQLWVKLNECELIPRVETLAGVDDDLPVTRAVYGNGKNGAEVILVTIRGGGHTWPGQKPPFEFLGRSAVRCSANDLMWDFFERHRMADRETKPRSE